MSRETKRSEKNQERIFSDKLRERFKSRVANDTIYCKGSLMKNESYRRRIKGTMSTMAFGTGNGGWGI